MMRANKIRMGNLVERPGLAEPLIQPLRMKNQLNLKERPDMVSWAPQGKTLVGGVQWGARVSRPGIAEPTMIAKGDAAGNAAKAATEANVGPVKAKVAAPKAAALAGWFLRR